MLLRELLIFLALALGLNIAMFLIAYRWQTDKLTDISYAATFALLALISFVSAGFSLERFIILLLVLAWAVRLGGYLLIRIHTLGRDARFDVIRQNFWAFGKFWLGQGLAVWVIMIPALLFMASQRPVKPLLLALGVVIWLFGFVLESAADWQKFRFIINPANKGRWIDEGLWRLARHPNYLGEMLMWIGVYGAVVSALTVGGTIVALASPIFIIVLLCFVSGVPPLEKSADQRWGKDAAYQSYKKRTRLIIPLPF